MFFCFLEKVFEIDFLVVEFDVFVFEQKVLQWFVVWFGMQIDFVFGVDYLMLGDVEVFGSGVQCVVDLVCMIVEVGEFGDLFVGCYFVFRNVVYNFVDLLVVIVLF